MNKSIASKASLLFDTSNDTRLLASSIVISSVIHLAVFVILILSPIHKAPKRYTPAFINVDLVSIPSPVSKSEPAAVKKKSTKASTVVSPKKSEKKVVLSSKKKIKRSLKKKTYKKPDIKKSALARLEKDLEKSRPDHLDKAIDRLKDQVTKDAGRHRAGVSGRPGVLDQQTATQIQIYNAEIFSIIQKNWAFSEQMTPNAQDLSAVLVIKIMQNGDISDVWFERKSGNGLLDDSAFKAVKKSDPLPKPPKGIGPYYEVGLRFTPSGLR